MQIEINKVSKQLFFFKGVVIRAKILRTILRCLQQRYLTKGGKQCYCRQTKINGTHLRGTQFTRERKEIGKVKQLTIYIPT